MYNTRTRARRCTPRRLQREDPRAEVGEEVCVGVRVRVGPVEFKLKSINSYLISQPI